MSNKPCKLGNAGFSGPHHTAEWMANDGPEINKVLIEDRLGPIVNVLQKNGMNASLMSEAITTIKSLRSELTASRDREEKAAIVIGWARGVVSGDGGESSLASALRSYDESSRAEKKEGG